MSRNRTRYTHAAKYATQSRKKTPVTQQDTSHATRHMSRNKTRVTRKDTCHARGHATHTLQDTPHTCMCMCVVSCCVTCARCVLLRVCVVSRCVSRNHTQDTYTYTYMCVACLLARHVCGVSCCVCVWCLVACRATTHNTHYLHATRHNTHMYTYTKEPLSHILNLQGQVSFSKEPAPGTQQDTAHTKHTKQTKRTQHYIQDNIHRKRQQNAKHFQQNTKHFQQTHCTACSLQGQVSFAQGPTFHCRTCLMGWQPCVGSPNGQDSFAKRALRNRGFFCKRANFPLSNVSYGVATMCELSCNGHDSFAKEPYEKEGSFAKEKAILRQ